MVKVKFCGLRRPEDISVVNELGVDYAGFVFAKKSRRYVGPETALELRKKLAPGISAVGVFVDEEPEEVARLIKDGVIDIAQLHGSENDAYIARLRELLGTAKKNVIQAFKIDSIEEVQKASKSSADMILLDSGAGSGKEFDWSLLKEIKRPYFLAGGLSVDNAAEAIERLRPYALDVSSGIETDGFKDKEKMALFMKNIGRR